MHEKVPKRGRTRKPPHTLQEYEVECSQTDDGKSELAIQEKILCEGS